MWMDQEIHGKDIREEVKRRIAGKVDVQLGKKGITDAFINEVKNRLEKHGVVKIRVLKSYIKTSGMDRREIARLVAERANAKIIDIRGYTFIIVKRNHR